MGIRNAVEGTAYRLGTRVFKAIYRYTFTCLGEHPPTGRTLFVSNHFGSLDPLLLAFGLKTRVAAFTRKAGHWGHPPLYIPSLFRIPLTSPLRQSLRQASCYLHRGYSLVIYPEGEARFHDTAGPHIRPFGRGMIFFARHLALSITPVAIAGANDVWPPRQRFPSRRGHIIINVGQTVAPPAHTTSLSGRQVDSAFCTQLQGCVETLHTEAGRYFA